MKTKFYRHCPECLKRMRKVESEGNPGRLRISYECRCGFTWRWEEETNSIRKGKINVSTEEQRELTLTEFLDKYNDPEMLETDGEDLVKVLAADPNTVWTRVEDGGDGEDLVLQGFHLVNRIGYFVVSP